MQPELEYLFVHSVAAAFDKQLYLADIIGDLDWHFDLASGRLAFGQHLHWQTQLLGTESEDTGTWLWAWANPTSDMPEPLLTMARRLRGIGAENHIVEFTEAQSSLDDIDGHTLALVASVVCEADAYF